jgi:FkbM family methyltransferase
VVCFEPLAAHVASIDHKIKLNQLNNIDVHAVALGDRSGVMSPHHPDFEATDNPGTASLLAGYNLNNNILESEVEVVVGDEFALVHDLPGPQILKIDVEGFEIPVLLGLKDVIAYHQPGSSWKPALSPGNRSMRWGLSMPCYRTRSSSM